jgi:hypothetical protein
MLPGFFVSKGTAGAFRHTFGVRVDGAAAQGFLSLTALRAEGCGIALSGDEYEVSVTGFTFSLSYDGPARRAVGFLRLTAAFGG